VESAPFVNIGLRLYLGILARCITKAGVQFYAPYAHSPKCALLVAMSSPARRIVRSTLELAQEAQVVGVEVAHILYVVLEHGDALDAHAECESGVLLGVVAHP
jgi:hypothetical protein